MKTHTTQEVIERLEVLRLKNEGDGLYVRANDCSLAIEAIEKLRAENERLLAERLIDPGQTIEILKQDLRREGRNMLAVIKKAEQLASRAIDWHLEEVEINDEMVDTRELRDEFRAAITDIVGKPADIGRPVPKHGSGP